MARNPLKVVLDTNILVSAIVFGGKLEQIIKLVQEGGIIPIISPILIAELIEILTKKFNFTIDKITLVEELIKENFKVVYPSQTIHVLADEDDNRVLEAAFKGECDYVVTGDNDLLDLKLYKNIKIITPHYFLSNVE